MTTLCLPENMSSILRKASEGRGLAPHEVKSLLDSNDRMTWSVAFDIARDLTTQNFQKQIHFFVPLYFSSYCVNNCEYCGFKRSNSQMLRKALTPSEFLEEARYLWNDGHRTIVLVAGEHPKYAGINQLEEYLNVLKQAELDFFVVVETAPLSISEYERLRKAGVHQVLLFQETYDQNLYQDIHEGPKRDFEWRYEAMDRALSAGVEKVGLGILLGLRSYKEDLVGLVDHARHIWNVFRKFPATLSFPRLRSSRGNESYQSPHLVTDHDFLKIIVAARLAFPHTGLILSTRESKEFREKLLEMGIGITHMSAGVSTVPGGYTQPPVEEAGQFCIEDLRRTEEVIDQVRNLGYLSLMHPQERSVNHDS